MSSTPSTVSPPARNRLRRPLPTARATTRPTPLDEALEALDAVVRSGKARYVGVSNWLAYKVARAIGRSEVKGLARIDSVQPRYNLLFRQIERELLPLCLEEGIGVIPYNPLAGGLLTGKHDRSAPPPEGGRFQLGPCGRDVPGPLLARRRVRRHRAAARFRQGGGRLDDDDGGCSGCWPTRPSRPPSSAPAAPTRSPTTSPLSAQPLDASLKARSRRNHHGVAHG